MYGWKARIGLLIPHRNTTIEPEFYKMAPEGVSVHAARMILKEPSPAALLEMEDEIYRAAEIITAVDPDIIIVGCTSGTLVGGFGYDRQIIEKITSLTDVAAITTSTAVIESLKLLDLKKISIATPYIDEVNQKEKAFIESQNIQVTQIKGLGLCKPQMQYPLTKKPASGIGLLHPSVAYKLAKDVDTQDAEGIFISCTNLRTIEIIDSLEVNTCKPVVSSNQASLAIALKKIGINEAVCGFGSLFQKHIS